MIKPIRIKGTSDYSYKGYIIGKYNGARNGTRWLCINDKGVDVAGGYTHLWKAVDYVDQHPLS